MADSKFRRPSEMKPPEDREPLSTRVKVSTRKALLKAAEEQNLSLAELVANVLDDYVAWLNSQPKSPSRKR